MFIAKWNNILTGRSGQKVAETEQEVNEWLSRKISKNHFGKPARQAVRGYEIFDESLVTSEFEDTDEFGETRTIVALKAEYEYSVGPIDMTANTEEAKNQRRIVALEKADQFKVFKNFGEILELYFTALINERGYTQAQKDAIQSNSDVLAILGELKFGRIGKAKGMVDAIVTDEDMFYEADLEAVSQLMADFLEDYV